MRNQSVLQFFSIILAFTLFVSCASDAELISNGKHFQKHKDYKSLKKTIELMPRNVTTIKVKKILGEPIDNGFDYRFLTDSVSTNRCPIGAVFIIDTQGKITKRWVDEICE